MATTLRPSAVTPSLASAAGSSVRAQARQSRASASGPSSSETCGQSRYATTATTKPRPIRARISAGGTMAMEPAAKPPAWKTRTGWDQGQPGFLDIGPRGRRAKVGPTNGSGRGLGVGGAEVDFSGDGARRGVMFVYEADLGHYCGQLFSLDTQRDL